MIAVDTNLLVYAHREDSPWHAAACRVISELAEGSSLWGIPWPSIHEFLAIVTHPRIYNPPTPLGNALDQVDAWIQSPHLVLLSEEARGSGFGRPNVGRGGIGASNSPHRIEGYWQKLQPLLKQGQIVGPQVHDARIAAICSLHGVRELWTADRDFGRFPNLAVRNPMVA